MKLLIVKFSSIGDCVMAAHAASAYRRTFPDGKLVWAVDPRCSAVIALGNVVDPTGSQAKLVDELFEIPWETWKAQKASPLTRIRHYLKLRAHKFDVAVDLQGHAKTAICLRLAGAKKRLSARAKDPLVEILNPVLDPIEHEHWVEEQYRCIKTLLPELVSDKSAIMPDIPITSEGKGTVTISVGSGFPKKNFARWAEVAELLIKQGEKVTFLGGPGEEAPSVEGATDLVGKMSLEETIGYLRSCKVHACADTGSGHICAAYGVPIVSVFGYTDPRLCAPYTPRRQILNAGKSMDKVEPKQIVEAIRSYNI